MSVVGLVSATGAVTLDRQVYWLPSQPTGKLPQFRISIGGNRKPDFVVTQIGLSCTHEQGRTGHGDKGKSR